MLDFKLTGILAGLATLATSYLGGWDQALSTLLIFVVVDYVTGVITAGRAKELSSKTGLKGIVKKVFILVLVGVAYRLDLALGLADPWLRTAVIWFLAANEGISILENAARAGAPVPSFLLRMLEQMRDKEAGRK